MSMALGTRHSAHGTWAISVSLLSTPEHLPLRGEKKLQIKMEMEKMRMVDEDDRVVVICPPKVVTTCVVLLPLRLLLLLLCFAMLHITSLTYYVKSLTLCAASCAT